MHVGKNLVGCCGKFEEVHYSFGHVWTFAPDDPLLRVDSGARETILASPTAVPTTFVRIPEDALSRTHAGVKSWNTKPDVDAWRFLHSFCIDLSLKASGQPDALHIANFPPLHLLYTCYN